MSILVSVPGLVIYLIATFFGMFINPLFTTVHTTISELSLRKGISAGVIVTALYMESWVNTFTEEAGVSTVKEVYELIKRQEEA